MRENQLSGRRLIGPLEEQLSHLHSHCTHGNRIFHYDQLVVAHLMVFFNPALTSLRTIEDAFDNPRIRKRAGLPRVPKSTLADAQRLFDPALLGKSFRFPKNLGSVHGHQKPTPFSEGTGDPDKVIQSARGRKEAR